MLQIREVSYVQSSQLNVSLVPLSYNCIPQVSSDAQYLMMIIDILDSHSHPQSGLLNSQYKRTSSSVELATSSQHQLMTVSGPSD
uniref:Uncharacterized protein n=1 Tax=Manihot esculenta TaxID=3983 RepID=A0A199UAE2_MANES